MEGKVSSNLFRAHGRAAVPKPFGLLKKVSRHELIDGKEIVLTEIDPMKRLKQFATQGRYKYRFNWDQFKNGVMCELELTYQLQGSQRRTLVKEVYFVRDGDVEYAQNVLASIVLDRLGLGPEEEDHSGEVTAFAATEMVEGVQRMATRGITAILSDIREDQAEGSAPNPLEALNRMVSDPPSSANEGLSMMLGMAKDLVNASSKSPEETTIVDGLFSIMSSRLTPAPPKTTSEPWEAEK